MQMNIEITSKREIKVQGENKYYLIKQEKDLFYIYVKYNDDNQLYYIECMKSIADALISVYNGYCHIYKGII